MQFPTRTCVGLRLFLLQQTLEPPRLEPRKTAELRGGIGVFGNERTHAYPRHFPTPLQEKMKADMQTLIQRAALLTWEQKTQPQVFKHHEEMVL